MVSVTSASSYITSVSQNHPCYSMYIRGLIPQNFAELAEAVPIGLKYDLTLCMQGNFSRFCCCLLNVFFFF